MKRAAVKKKKIHTEQETLFLNIHPMNYRERKRDENILSHEEVIV